jgi:hypothetical protein
MSKEVIGMERLQNKKRRVIQVEGGINLGGVLHIYEGYVER